MAKKSRLPKRIFVYREHDGETSYLVANEALYDAADKDETRLVGTYELVEQGSIGLSVEYNKK